MSGNSGWRRRRPRRSYANAAAPAVCALWLLSSSSQEGEPVLADRTSSSSSSSADSIRFLVHEGAVEAAEVADRERLALPRCSACLRETVTSPRKTSHSGERPISVRSLGEEALPRPAASGADDERRPPSSRGPAPLRRGRRDLLRRVSHRLLTGLALSRRAAAGAAVRGRRVLEPALPAVDVAHALHALVVLGRAPRRENVRERLDVDVRDPLALQPCGPLRAQDVDPPFSSRRRKETSFSSSVSWSISCLRSSSESGPDREAIP